MQIKKKLVLAVAAGIALMAPGCRKFMDVNTNPNVSQTATVQTLLPAAQLYLGSSMGVDLQIIGSIWSQYWTQSPNGKQYIQIEQYTASQDAFSRAWTNLYAGAENFYQLYKLSDTQGRQQYKAIALLMQAYTFQVITDAWGDAPYSQALKGQYSSGHFVNPKYDSQVTIYRGIIANIDTARKLITTGAGSRPGGDDLIYGGDMNKWLKFANTLQLKVLLRMAYIDPVNTPAKISLFFNSGATPQFIGNGDDAKISYGSNAAGKNPLYAEESSIQLGSIQNLAGSKTCIDSMNSNHDPRVTAFYEPVMGVYTGIAQSAYNVPMASGTFSIPSPYVGGDIQNPASANAPVNLLTSWESYFMQAEVAARLWAIGGTDNTLFYQGVMASFNYYNNALSNTYTPTTGSAYNDYISAGGYWTMYPTGGTMAAKLRYIITQKWFAMCGNQGFEAWTEWRRTGYPDFLVQPFNSTIKPLRPERFLYPTSESANNSNFPATGVLPLTMKVWWDVL